MRWNAYPPTVDTALWIMNRREPNRWNEWHLHIQRRTLPLWFGAAERDEKTTFSHTPATARHHQGSRLWLGRWQVTFGLRQRHSLEPDWTLRALGPRA